MSWSKKIGVSAFSAVAFHISRPLISGEYHSYTRERSISIPKATNCFPLDLGGDHFPNKFLKIYFLWLRIDIFSNTYTSPFNDWCEENQYLVMIAIMWYVRYFLLLKYCRELCELLSGSCDCMIHTEISKDILSLCVQYCAAE